MSQTTEYLYGYHAVEAVLQYAPQRVLEVFLLQTAELPRLDHLIRLAEKQGLSIQSAARGRLEKMVGDAAHQGIVARCRVANLLSEHDLMTFLDQLNDKPFLLILDEIQDPHNLGACLRTAVAAGVHAVVVPKQHSVGLTPAVRKVSSGASEIIPVFTVTNLARTLAGLRDRSITCFGLDAEGTDSIYQVDLTGPTALVLGSEGKGLRRLTAQNCDHLVKIPMRGSMPSLNVSVAAGVALFAVVQKQLPKE